MSAEKPISEKAITAARCHEIQVSLGTKEVPEFESIPLIGMAVRLALHIRGLAIIDYEVIKLVASHYLAIPTVVVDRILRILAELEFVRLQQQGQTIKRVLPTVPYYEDLYDEVGEFASVEGMFNEAEQLALYLVNRLSAAPETLDSLRNNSGAEKQLFERGLSLGIEGSYLIKRRARGRDVLLSPTYFSENPDIFADAVAGQGATSVSTLLATLAEHQGYPLKLIIQRGAIGDHKLTPDQIRLLKRLAQDGAVRPPSIITPHAGEHQFIFTPTPSGAALSPTQRDIFERAMAIVAAVRQGQFLPQQYAIRSPIALLYKLKTELRLGRATTEAAEQYKNLVHLRIGRLVPSGGGFYRFEVVDTPENREALEIAYSLVSGGMTDNTGVDKDARAALQRDQKYVESLVSVAALRQREQVSLNPEQQLELDLLLLGDETG